MDKKLHILNEIKRTAQKNGEVPLGKARFHSVTGIKQSDWFGKPWNNWNSWGDAVKEAGFEVNEFQKAYEVNFLLDQLIKLIRKLGHYPVEAEIIRESSINPDFPSKTAWTKLGYKKDRVKAIVEFCNKSSEEYKDILEICRPIHKAAPERDQNDSDEIENFGFVYLMKSGKHYKIGCTNSLDRRQYEIGMQLPEKIQPIHSIRTDDPSGIEAYWHNRFKAKRLNGEWFDLAASDVRIFKKRNFM